MTPDPLPFAHEDLRRPLADALARGGDFAEIFLERRRSLRLSRREGRLAASAAGTALGAGVRTVLDGRTGYASVSSHDPEALREAARAAAEVADAPGPAPPVVLGPPPLLLGPPTHDEAPAAAAELIEEAEAAARRFDPAVAGVEASWSHQIRSFLLLDSRGLVAAAEQTLLNLQVLVLARRGDALRTARAARTLSGPAAALDADQAAEVARDAARKALRLLEAREIPAGPYPVVFAPGEGAILFHEAVGHSLEGDIVLSGNSLFRDRLGTTVAAPGVTLVDDPTVPGLGGSFLVDDEGTPARHTALIEGGVLKGFLHDRLSAERLKAAPTGNGRRQDHRFPPIPRMTNTFLAAGADDPDEILSSVKRGLYVRAVGAGQSNSKSGAFTFEVLDADWIEAGRRVHPVWNTSLVGDALTVLKDLDRIGRDFAFGRAGGFCGKGQLVPVEGGMPTVRVRELIVGGRKR